jgi:hypothetical protein
MKIEVDVRDGVLLGILVGRGLPRDVKSVADLEHRLEGEFHLLAKKYYSDEEYMKLSVDWSGGDVMWDHDCWLAAYVLDDDEALAPESQMLAAILRHFVLDNVEELCRTGV